MQINLRILKMYIWKDWYCYSISKDIDKLIKVNLKIDRYTTIHINEVLLSKRT